MITGRSDGQKFNKKVNTGKAPLADKVKRYFDDYTGSECRAPTYGKVPTWKLEPAKVDFSLTKEVSKHDKKVQPRSWLTAKCNKL